MADASSLERLLRRDRAITVAALLVLCALAWAHVIFGAGLGAPAWSMTSLGLPDAITGAGMAPAEPGAMDMAGMSAAAMEAGGAVRAGEALATRVLLTVLMWWSMMVAMMAPSAAPMVLLYARVARTSRMSASERIFGHTGWFVAGYLGVWLGFSVLATLLQLGLERVAWISTGMMAAESRGFAAGVLLAAGVYQLSPVQNVCLRRCRAPAAFLAEHYRPGASGAVWLGALHGAYCVGCCWLLMALLFVGGVMNLAWIAALTLLVAAEKLLPGGSWIARAAGAGLIAWGAFVLI